MLRLCLTGRILPRSRKRQQHRSGSQWAALLLCCCLCCTSWALTAARRVCGAGVSSREKKIICLQVTSSHSGWLQETCYCCQRHHSCYSNCKADSPPASRCHTPHLKIRQSQEGGDGQRNQLVKRTFCSQGQCC